MAQSLQQVSILPQKIATILLAAFVVGLILLFVSYYLTSKTR